MPSTNAIGGQDHEGRRKVADQYVPPGVPNYTSPRFGFDPAERGSCWRRRAIPAGEFSRFHYIRAYRKNHEQIAVELQRCGNASWESTWAPEPGFPNLLDAQSGSVTLPKQLGRRLQ